jgi:hypothetical protein
MRVLTYNSRIWQKQHIDPSFGPNWLEALALDRNPSLQLVALYHVWLLTA